MLITADIILITLLQTSIRAWQKDVTALRVMPTRAMRGFVEFYVYVDAA